MDARVTTENELGAYLKACRAKLDPTSFGFPLARRRTPGLRREEVAQRAHVSATWYTWLEQGRGGAPSAAVLDRIARALALTEVEREHLFLLGSGRPPEAHYQPSASIAPHLQRVLDAMPYSPAIVITPAFDIVAWNRAATRVLTDYAKLPVRERNVLRMVFLEPRVRAAQADWQAVARFVVATFRTNVARAGATRQVEALVSELTRRSPEFAALWRDHDVRAHSENTKRMRHPQAGTILLEYSAFAVDGRPDLAMIVYNAATGEDAARIRALIDRDAASAEPQRTQAAPVALMKSTNARNGAGTKRRPG